MRIIIIQIIDEPRILAHTASVLKNIALVLSLLVQDIASQICRNCILCIYSDFMFDWGRKTFFAGEGDQDVFWITKLNVLHQDVMNCLKFFYLKNIESILVNSLKYSFNCSCI